MRAFKYTVWITVLFLVQTVVMGHISPGGIRADIILPFIAVSAIKENSFRMSTAVTIICAAAAGALCGRNFSLCVLFYTYFGALVFAMRRRPRYMPDFMRYIVWTVPAALISEVLSCLLLYSSLARTGNMFFERALPAAAVTVTAALIIYPLADFALYRNER